MSESVKRCVGRTVIPWPSIGRGWVPEHPWKLVERWNFREEWVG